MEWDLWIKLFYYKTYFAKLLQLFCVRHFYSSKNMSNIIIILFVRSVNMNYIFLVFNPAWKESLQGLQIK